MPVITISGEAGSGTSTLVDGLCRLYGWSYLNGGMVFRQEAERRGVSLAEFGEICKEDLSVDRMLDERLIETMKQEGGPQVVESRLSGWWAHREGIECIRLWLDVSAQVRAARVVSREGGSVEQRLQEIDARSERDLIRFEELYSLAPHDPEPYSHVLKADDLDADQVLEAVVSIIEEGSE